MVVTSDDAVFVHRHTFGPEAITWIERIDPITLECVERSPDLAGGPYWAGGLAFYNDSLYVVFGYHCHRLDIALQPIRSVTLPVLRPYNSFVTLPDGSLVMKDIVLDASAPSRFSVLDPSLDAVKEFDAPEPSIARLSANGDDIYFVGDHTIYRYRGLELDDWRFTYRTLPGQTYGWDPVIAAGSVWFMDQGEWKHGPRLKGAGVGEGPVQLIRVSTADASDVNVVEVCGAPSGAITNPPLVDEARRIVVAYDSANGFVTAWRIDGLERLWRREQFHSAHMLLFADSGELVTNDMPDGTDHVVVLDIETGEELSRIDTGSPAQSMLFPAPGFDHDVYYCSFTTLARGAA